MLSWKLIPCYVFSCLERHTPALLASFLLAPPGKQPAAPPMHRRCHVTALTQLCRPPPPSAHARILLLPQQPQLIALHWEIHHPHIYFKSQNLKIFNSFTCTVRKFPNYCTCIASHDTHLKWQNVFHYKMNCVQ